MILKLTEKNSFVISINDKRYKLFKKIFNYYQLPLPKLFNGVKHNNPVLGCLLSHYNILKLATLWSLPYIFVFEDDVLLELANKIFHNFNMYISKNILFVQHNLHKEKTIHNNFMNNSLKRINPNLGIISDFEPNIFE